MLIQQFQIENNRTENKNRMGGWIVTIAVHAMILLILLFIYITPPNPPFEDNQGGMTVNYGTSDVGTGDEQQFTAVPVTVQQTAQAEQQSQPEASSSQENLETQNNEDAPVVEAKKDIKKPKDKPNPDAILKPKPKPATNNTPPTPKPQVNKDAMFPSGAMGKPNKSKGDGEGHGIGDQGDPNGDPNSKNYHGGGTGNGPGKGGDGDGRYQSDGIKDGNVRLKNRTIKGKPQFSYKCEAHGKVVMSIKVNKMGRVIDAYFTQSGSTTADECLIGRARQLAMDYRFDENSTAADVQLGSIEFFFREH
jgi:outer membrane biosynthesis protein TonB